VVLRTNAYTEGSPPGKTSRYGIVRTRFTIGEQIGRKNFEGHFAFEAFIARAVNHTHPAFAKLLDDEIVRET
jgi:hypothetical protein